MSKRTAVISGSSRGIGAAIAQELSQRGVSIVLNYPTPSLKDECEAVGKTLATEWIAVCADLTDDDAGAAHLVREAVARFGHIDVLVSNAGIVPLGPLWTSSLDDFDRAMRLNARGAYALVLAALPHLTPYAPPPPATLRHQSGAVGGSRIIVVGSAASRNARAGQGAYAATKGALDAVLRVWARELPARYGCTVNMVAPGPVLTQTFREHFATEDEWAAVREAMVRETPVEGIAAAPEDVAWAVAFLAEERSRFINGEYLCVSGGSTMG
ncbi:hypothetical protein F4820DRAFT_466716 [Hypoxylon rubiginosum]|uniref:Uncharacterized protein n=1 Tax=Hypoxylon rubiginosum TaxID=110542 RepID=A0ACB9YK51_9PEZI|nr:hypothetical protein F4820DRAFT_466716 [Hypoxylon rubiginosum]